MDVVTRTAISLLTVTLLGLACCTTGPQPFPLPLAPPSDEQIFLAARVEGTSVLTGLPGAVTVNQDGIEIVIENVDAHATHRAAVHPDGSFMLDVAWTQGDVLQARVVVGDRNSEGVAVPLPPPIGPDPPPTPTALAAAPQAGNVEVLGTAAAGALVIVGNRDTGAVSSGTATDGQYRVTIAASTDDELVVYSVSQSSRVPSEPETAPFGCTACADLNGDGVVNILDKVIMRDALGSGSYLQRADLDEDGDNDLADKTCVRNDFGKLVDCFMCIVNGQCEDGETVDNCPDDCP